MKDRVQHQVSIFVRADTSKLESSLEFRAHVLRVGRVNWGANVTLLCRALQRQTHKIMDISCVLRSNCHPLRTWRSPVPLRREQPWPIGYFCLPSLLSRTHQIFKIDELLKSTSCSIVRNLITSPGDRGRSVSSWQYFLDVPLAGHCSPSWKGHTRIASRRATRCPSFPLPLSSFENAPVYPSFRRRRYSIRSLTPPNPSFFDFVELT